MDPVLQKYSRRNFSSVLFVAGLVVLACGALHWWFGDDKTMAALITALGLVLCGLAGRGRSKGQLDSYPIVIATVFCNFFGVLIIIKLREVGIYWFYPLLIAAAYTLPWRWSVPVNAINVSAALISAATWMPAPLYYRLAATLIIVLIFAGMFSFNIARHEKMLQDLAAHDPLTGAFNRRYFEEVLDETRRHWRRTGRTASMLFIDLDHFKKVNDTYGHGVGDTVLIAFSQFVSGMLRPMDRFFRLGGEEFAILLPETPAHQGARMAERIRKRIAEGALKKGLPRFTISCGVSEYPERASASDWPDRCDAALYAAKAAGRNRVELAEPDLDTLASADVLNTSTTG